MAHKEVGLHYDAIFCIHTINLINLLSNPGQFVKQDDPDKRIA